MRTKSVKLENQNYIASLNRLCLQAFTALNQDHSKTILNIASIQVHQAAQLMLTSVLQPTVKLEQGQICNLGCENTNSWLTSGRSWNGRLFSSEREIHKTLLTFHWWSIFSYQDAQMSWLCQPMQKAATDVPLIIQCFPSFVFLAIVLRPETSLPAKASVMAKQISFLPDNTSGMTFSLIAGLPKFKTGGRPITDPAINPEMPEYKNGIDCIGEDNLPSP